jgi:HEAT repeat protein
MRRPKLRTVVYLSAIAILAVMNWRLLHPHEPTYEGKPLSAWLDYYYSNGVAYPHPEGWEAAKARAEFAIRKMGTNSLPALIKMISAREYALKQTSLEQARMETPGHLPIDRDNNRHWRAVYAFEVLGSNAAPAVPALIQLLNDRDPDVRSAVAVACGWVGPSAQDAVPALVNRYLSDASDEVGLYSAQSLGWIQPEPEQVLPALVKNLEKGGGRRWLTYDETFLVLGKLGPKAQAAVPTLLKIVNDQNDPTFRTSAARALKKIDPAAAAKAGVE